MLNVEGKELEAWEVWVGGEKEDEEQQPEKCQREKRRAQLAVRFYWEVSDRDGEREESKEAGSP